MNAAQYILILDAVAVLASYYAFRTMAEGRRMLTGAYTPQPTRSELYAAQNAWRQ
jgi:hypothetical protein